MSEQNKEGRGMRWLLILQSFVPLFILLLIKYIDISYFCLMGKFISHFINSPFNTIKEASGHKDLCATILMILCIIEIVAGFLVYIFFEKIQRSSYIDKQEKVTVLEDTTGDGVVFFVSYILPLMMDDINQMKGFFSFTLVLVMIVSLMRNTNLYYQNPILTILGYRTFKFSFKNTPYTISTEQEFIAITKGRFDSSKIVIRKKVADNVYIMYNKN